MLCKGYEVFLWFSFFFFLETADKSLFFCLFSQCDVFCLPHVVPCCPAPHLTSLPNCFLYTQDISLCALDKKESILSKSLSGHRLKEAGCYLKSYMAPSWELFALTSLFTQSKYTVRHSECPVRTDFLLWDTSERHFCLCIFRQTVGDGLY